MENSKLTTTQMKAISCILDSNSIEEAAKKAKISRGSIYNWMKDENFKKRLQNERNVLFAESLDLLKQANLKAVEVLIKLLNSKDEKNQRLAAKEIINMSMKVAENRDFEIRISRIENLIRENIRNG